MICAHAYAHNTQGTIRMHTVLCTILQIMHAQACAIVCVCVHVRACVCAHVCVHVCVCNVNILYAVLVCMCVHALLYTTLITSTHMLLAIVTPALHAYQFMSFATFNVGGKPLQSLRAVPRAKMSSSRRSWSNFSLVKKLSKNT